MTRGVVHARVYLAARDAAGLAAAATAESTPGSPRYRHFLSPAQVQARFGQTPARIAAVRGWLRGAGLRVTGVSDHVADGYLAATGSVAAASRAFGVRFARYRLAGQGLVRAPEQAVSVPADVAASVLDVTGLSTARQVMQHMTVQQTAAQRAAVQQSGRGSSRRRPSCRRRARTTGSPGPAGRTTTRRSRRASRRPTAGTGRGRCAATRRARCAARTG